MARNARVLLCLTAILLTVCARRESLDFLSESTLRGLGETFGCASGCLVEVDVETDPADEWLYAVLFTSEQVATSEVAESQIWSSLCMLPSELRYEFRHKLHFRYNVSSVDIYRMMLVNCNQRSVKVTGEVTYLNPGGDHMSLEQIPLVTLYTVLVAFYSVLLIVWLASSWKFAQRSLPIQRVVTFAIVCKLLDVLFQTLYRRQYSSDGEEISLLRRMQDFFFVLAEAVFLALLLLVAMGWSVVRLSLTKREKRAFAFAFICFTIFNVLRQLCSTPDTCSAYTLSFYVVRFLINFGIIIAMNANIERLRAESGDQDWRIAVKHTYQRLKVFLAFRYAFLAYLVVPIMILFVEFTVLSWYQEWVSELFEEMLFAYVLLKIAAVFRPRSNQIFQLPHQRARAVMVPAGGQGPAGGPGAAPGAAANPANAAARTAQPAAPAPAAGSPNAARTAAATQGTSSAVASASVAAPRAGMPHVASPTNVRIIMAEGGVSYNVNIGGPRAVPAPAPQPAVAPADSNADGTDNMVHQTYADSASGFTHTHTRSSGRPVEGDVSLPHQLPRTHSELHAAAPLQVS